MSNEEHIVIAACVRVKDAPADYEAACYRAEGSRFSKVRCPKCKEQIYLGTRQAVLVGAGKAKLLCTCCAGERIAQADVTAATHLPLSKFVDPPDA